MTLILEQRSDSEAVLILTPWSETRPATTYWRDNDHQTWRRVRSRQQIESLITGRDLRNPFVTFERPWKPNGRPDTDPAGIFEVLYDDPGNVFVSGGVRNETEVNYWSSWCEPRTPGPEITAGPSWYRAKLYTGQSQTVHDALAQAETALNARLWRARSVPGYLWLNRSEDLDNRSLRGT